MPSDMENWLVEDAKENVWCRPQVDHKLIAKPKRLTASEGDIHSITVSRINVRLPDVTKWYHVFQLGAMPYRTFGLGTIGNQWARMDRVVNAYNISIVIYDVSGRVFPLHLTWIRRLPNGNYIVAAQSYDLQTDFGVTDMYIRFYDGHFHYTEEFNPEIHGITAISKVVENQVDITNTVVEYKELVKRGGDVKAYINGYEIDVLNFNDLKPWDLIDIVRDGMVSDVHYFNVKDLLTFTSTLDKERKYLLHPPKHADTIKLINDCMVSVFNGNDGRYYHQNNSASLRQVTHHDYSVSTHNVQDLITLNDSWSNSDNLRIKVSIRHSGMKRNLIFEENRIHELYKLPDDKIVLAMVGSNSTVPEWQAANLENSAYVKIMAASCPNITNEVCTDAYGYNSLSHYVADTPQKTNIKDGSNYVTLPPLLARNCTVYEYDRDGLLLGWHLHTSDTIDEYYCKDNNTVYIEAIEGAGTEKLSIDYNAAASKTKVVPGVNYRFYVDILKSGVPRNEFEDVTGTDKYSVDSNGNVTWNVDLTRRQPAMWADFGFLAYEFTGELSTGDLRFTVNHFCDEHIRHILYFCPETIEIWMNGHSLVHNVDFYVKWPEVVICNRQFLTNDATRLNPKITVRCRGISDAIRAPKFGYVIDGMLSNNCTFDVRDDKVVRIVVDGKMMHREQLDFAEDGTLHTKQRNGAPYSVGDATVPLRNITHRNTYELRDEARTIDRRVEDYLSVYLPQKPTVSDNPITRKHGIFSPILHKVIYDMQVGNLVPVEDDETNIISDRQFDEIMENYKSFLDFEPVRNHADQKYLSIHPHAYASQIELTPIQYSLVGRIVARYLFNSVVINHDILVKVDSK